MMAALLIWTFGFGFSLVWLWRFWHEPRRVPAPVLAAPLLAALVVAVGADFTVGNWVSFVNLTMMACAFVTGAALLVKRASSQIRSA